MREKDIVYDKQGLKPKTPNEKAPWVKIASHNENEIKGFFGDYRFLSNFWPAIIYLDEEEYPSVENAYQAAKYKKEDRNYLKTCSASEAKKLIPYSSMYKYTVEEWDNIRLQIMSSLII